MENKHPYFLRNRGQGTDNRGQQPNAEQPRPTSASDSPQVTQAFEDLKETVTMKIFEIKNVLENSTSRIRIAESDEYSDHETLALAVTQHQLNQLKEQLANMDTWMEQQITNHPVLNVSDQRETYLKEAYEHLYTSNPLALRSQIQARITDIDVIFADIGLGTTAELLADHRERGGEEDITAIMEDNKQYTEEGDINDGERTLEEDAPDKPPTEPPVDGQNDHERFQSATQSLHDDGSSGNSSINNMTGYNATFTEKIQRKPTSSDGDPTETRGKASESRSREAELEKALEERIREIQELELKHQRAQEANKAQKAKEAEKAKSNQILVEKEMARLKYNAQKAQQDLEQAKNDEATLKGRLDRAKAQSRDLEDQLRKSHANNDRDLTTDPAHQDRHHFGSSSDNGGPGAGQRPEDHRLHSTLNLAHDYDQTTPILEAPRIHMSPIQENPTSLRQVLAEMAHLKDMLQRGQENARRVPATPRPIPFEIRKPRLNASNSCPGIKKIQDAVQAIPQYSGDDKSNFRTFYERVIRLVHDNPAFDMVQKGLVLEQLLTGKARDCIAAADDAEKAYSRTLELLCQTYGNEENTEDEVLAKFRELDLNFYAVIDDTLQQLSKHAALTSQLSETAQGSSGTAKRLLLEKIPDDLRFELTRKERALREEDQPKLNMSETLEFIRCYLMDRKTANRHSASGLAPRAYRSVYYTEAQQQQTVMVTAAQHTTSAPSGYHSGERQQAAKHNQSNPDQQGKSKSATLYRSEARKKMILATTPSWTLGVGPSIVALQYIFPLQSPRDSLRCALCGPGHSTTACPIPPAEVKKRIEAEGRCIACGHRNHTSSECKFTMLCVACQGRHTTAGCERKTFYMQPGNWPAMAVEPRQLTFFRGPQGQQ